MTYCFLCGVEIKEKITKEHIFGDAFLGNHGLKLQKMNYGSNSETEYSRLKVPAHQKCNSENGSRFENYVLSLLDEMHLNLDVMRELHVPAHSKAAAQVKEALCQWMAKIYLGLTFWEVGRDDHPDAEYQKLLEDVLNTPLIDYLQSCFANDYAFNCPSSLYYFSVPDGEDGLAFDFATRHDVGGAYVKIGKHLLVTALADGRLVEHWLNDDLYQSIQAYVTQHAEADPTAYLAAVGHVWAVRENLPVKPNLEFSEEKIIDRSRDGYALAPGIDADTVNRRALDFRNDLAKRFQAE